MPELPEVETVRAGVEHHVVGRTVAAAEVMNPRAVRRDPSGPDGFAAAMAGRTFLRAERRGKYLWFALDDGRVARPMAKTAIVSAAQPVDVSRGDDPPYPSTPYPPTEALLAHLGMSGQLLVGDPGRPVDPHVRARFTFTDGGPDLRFTDQRTFGHLMMVPLAYPDDRSRVVPQPIAHIAADPLEAAFDAKDFAARLRRKKTQVKRALLDQSLISGIGNIYADEALWRARLHWARPTETLKPSELSRLLEAVRDVLTEALKAGGTSFDALYVNVNGESGYFDRSLHAYGREGEPCDRCATPIRRDAFMNRSSYSCPRCQK
ncbi:MAG TPA: bifunctional DNA-formamidopyrimidine glycosylase/DNA-(apurinic or apyrimidinic site) lyase [Trebonia sp.]|nr:bifunctional DNA-formamidopyrimidine glycosylase/DNA-(apurinic or apyrimidinic site) lyase [Trebonia sp.]